MKSLTWGNCEVEMGKVARAVLCHFVITERGRQIQTCLIPQHYLVLSRFLTEISRAKYLLLNRLHCPHSAKSPFLSSKQTNPKEVSKAHSYLSQRPQAPSAKPQYSNISHGTTILKTFQSPFTRTPFTTSIPS